MGVAAGAVADFTIPKLLLENQQKWADKVWMRKKEFGFEEAEGTLLQGDRLILSADGREVRRIRRESEGRYYWDGKDSRGVPLPSGVYYASALGLGRQAIRLAE